MLSIRRLVGAETFLCWSVNWALIGICSVLLLAAHGYKYSVLDCHCTGLASDGTRSELETHLEKALQKRTAGTWVWEKLPEVVQPCFGGSMVEWNGGIYLFGGYGGDGQASNCLYTWHPGYISWQQVLPADGGMVPPALYHHSAGKCIALSSHLLDVFRIVVCFS